MKNIVTFIILLTVVNISMAAEWPRFRGVNGTGVAPDNRQLPIKWTTTENVSWVADVPGWGWSCPVVWGNRVFVTSVVSDQKNLTPSKGLYLGQGVRDPAKGLHHWMVYCFDLQTGNKLWTHEAHTGEPRVPRHPKSTYAAETPTTDGKRLYVLFGDLGLYCYNLDGKPLWSQAIEPKKTFQDYGAAASPVVHDGKVFVVYDNLEKSWIAAFDGATGKELWRKPRDETHSWATPLVWTNDLRTELVVPGKKRNRGYSLDGDLLWEFDGRMSNLVIPSPFTAHGLCYIASGYIGDRHRPTFAIRPGATGNIAPDGKLSKSKHIAWYQGQASSYNPTQIVYGDYLYTLYDRGFLTCHNAKSGKEVYSKRRLRPSGSFTASPWAYNGCIFLLNEDGLTYVVKAGPEFEILDTCDLDELCLSTPSIAGRHLLIRTASAVYCLTEGAKLDVERIRTTRPKVSKRLQDQATEAPTKSAAAIEINPDAASEARILLQDAIKSGKVAGGAHLVVRNGKTVHFEVGGKRDIEEDLPFQKDSILRFYSMSKPITSVAAMTLFDQGKFKLDDPISKFIPEFKETTVLVKDGEGVKTLPARRQITVRDVFRHTTGYSYGDGNPTPRRYYEMAGMRYRNPVGMYPPKMTIEKAAIALSQIPAQHHPGERFTYGFSTDLLGRLIEVWSGQTLDQYLQKAVFAPLEMRDTGFAIPQKKRHRFASCHTLRNGKLAIIDKASTSEFNKGFEFLSGGGGFVSTIQDYANFCQMLVDDGTFKGRRVLKPETVQLMFTDQLNGAAGNFKFGLGFAIADVKVGTGDDQRTVKQYSWGGYASTDFRIVPKEKLFQIVVRQRVPSDHRLAGRVFSIIYRGIP